jgi:hypothetical protein
MDILMCREIEKNYISAHNPNYFVTATVFVVAWNAAVLNSRSQSSLPCILRTLQCKLVLAYSLLIGHLRAREL